MEQDLVRSAENKVVTVADHDLVHERFLNSTPRSLLEYITEKHEEIQLGLSRTDYRWDAMGVAFRVALFLQQDGIASEVVALFGAPVRVQSLERSDEPPILVPVHTSITSPLLQGRDLMGHFAIRFSMSERSFFIDPLVSATPMEKGEYLRAFTASIPSDPETLRKITMHLKDEFPPNRYKILPLEKTNIDVEVVYEGRELSKELEEFIESYRTALAPGYVPLFRLFACMVAPDLEVRMTAVGLLGTLLHPAERGESLGLVASRHVRTHEVHTFLKFPRLFKLRDEKLKALLDFDNVGTPSAFYFRPLDLLGDYEDNQTVDESLVLSTLNSEAERNGLDLPGLLLETLQMLVHYPSGTARDIFGVAHLLAGHLLEEGDPRHEEVHQVVKKRQGELIGQIKAFILDGRWGHDMSSGLDRSFWDDD